MNYKNYPIKEEVKLPKLKTCLLNHQVSAKIIMDSHFRNIFCYDKEEIEYPYNDARIFKELCDYLFSYIISEERKIKNDPTIQKLELEIEKLKKDIPLEKERYLKKKLEEKKTSLRIRGEILTRKLDEDIIKTKFSTGERTISISSPILELVEESKSLALREDYNHIERFLKL
jgi:hypothetical protein